MRKLATAFVMAGFMVAGLLAPVSAQNADDDWITGLQATRNELHKIVLTWIAVPGASNYEIWADGALLGSSNNNWFVATGLDEDRHYDFSVASDNGYQSQDPTSASTGKETAPGPLEAPTTPGVRTRFVTGDNLAIRLPDGRFEVRRDGAVVGTDQFVTFRDSGLTPGTSYQYEFRFIGANRELGPALVLDIETARILGPIENLRVEELAPGKVRLTWDPLEDATHYTVLVNGRVKVSFAANQGPERTLNGFLDPEPTTFGVYGSNGTASPVTEVVYTPPATMPSCSAVLLANGQVEISWANTAGQPVVRRNTHYLGTPDRSDSSFIDTNPLTASYTLRLWTADGFTDVDCGTVVLFYCAMAVIEDGHVKISWGEAVGQPVVRRNGQYLRTPAPSDRDFIDTNPTVSESEYTLRLWADGGFTDHDCVGRN